jgi:glycosyltransferase involved in cell wall biosynthesis
MKVTLDDYADIAGKDVVVHLREIAAPLAGKTVVHVNSTRIGGGAEIFLQVVNNHTGFLVNRPEGAAFRIRYLLNRPEEAARMGETGHRFVRENYLLTRHLREYLTLMVALVHGAGDRIELPS